MIYIILLLIYIFIYSIELSEYYIQSINNRTINKDGFCVIHNYNYLHNIPLLKKDVLNILPKNYVFLDYQYSIINSAVSTFHRDISSRKIYNTKYDVYTVILYKYSGDLLSVCPGSNNTYPFVNSHIVNINGQKGTVFIFKCELLHAGCINYCKDREIIQFKVCHKKDIKKLKHLNNINIKKYDKCKNSFNDKLLRKLSYYFEFPINYIFYPLMIDRKNDNSLLGKIQSYIPLNYYNNV